MNKEYTDEEKEVIHSATMKAMKLLEFSDRTEKQLRDRLKEGEFPPFAVEEAISYVYSYHYLDDERYADVYVRSKKGSKSRFEMKNDLLQRGVDKDIISRVLEENATDDQEPCLNLIRKKYRNKDLTDRKTLEKVYRYLAPKGYSFEVIRKALETLVSESEEAGDDTF